MVNRNFHVNEFGEEQEEQMKPDGLAAGDEYREQAELMKPDVLGGLLVRSIAERQQRDSSLRKSQECVMLAHMRLLQKGCILHRERRRPPRRMPFYDQKSECSPRALGIWLHLDYLSGWE